MLEDSFLLPGVFRMPGTLTGATERLSAAIWKQRNVNKTWRDHKNIGNTGAGGTKQTQDGYLFTLSEPECTAVL